MMGEQFRSAQPVSSGRASFRFLPRISLLPGAGLLRTESAAVGIPRPPLPRCDPGRPDRDGNDARRPPGGSPPAERSRRSHGHRGRSHPRLLDFVRRQSAAPGIALDAIRDASGLPLTRGAPPSISDLRRLETLGAQLDTLAGYERNGPPLRLEWGLYAGSSIFPALRRSYFEGFERLLFATTRDSMVAELAALPDAPDSASDYGATYNTLKAYLITALHPEKSTEAFLGPALMSTGAPVVRPTHPFGPRPAPVRSLCPRARDRQPIPDHAR